MQSFHERQTNAYIIVRSPICVCNGVHASPWQNASLLSLGAHTLPIPLVLRICNVVSRFGPPLI